MIVKLKVLQSCIWVVVESNDCTTLIDYFESETSADIALQKTVFLASLTSQNSVIWGDKTFLATHNTVLYLPPPGIASMFPRMKKEVGIFQQSSSYIPLEIRLPLAWHRLIMEQLIFILLHDAERGSTAMSTALRNATTQYKLQTKQTFRDSKNFLIFYTQLMPTSGDDSLKQPKLSTEGFSQEWFDILLQPCCK